MKQSQKEIAQSMAADIVQDRKTEVQDMFVTFVMNPTNAVTECLQERVEAYKKAREQRHRIAEWKVEG